jgi:hypothetical protein
MDEMSSLGSSSSSSCSDDEEEEDAGPPPASIFSMPQSNYKATLGIEPGGLTPGAYQIQPRGRRGLIPVRELPLSDRLFDSTMGFNVSQHMSSVNDNDAAPGETIQPTMSHASPAMNATLCDSSQQMEAQYVIQPPDAHSRPKSRSIGKYKRVVFGFLLLTITVVGVSVGLTLTGRDKGTSPSELSSTLDPCDSPHQHHNVQTQCFCRSKIDFVSDVTLDKYALFRAILGLSATDTYSCEADNLALMVLAASTNGTNVSDDVLLMHYVFNVMFLSLQGNTWTQNYGWLEFNSTCPCCLYGVACKEDNVVAIDLAKNGLAGSIPPEIGLLTALTMLNLSENEMIAGEVPAEIGRLANLEVLRLDVNMLSSTLPSALGTLTELTFFSIERNRLSGSLPSELKSLTKLEKFAVGQNAIIHYGPVPIWHLTTLTDLSLAGCRLTGTIPWSQLGLMSTMAQLDLSDNYLTGTISSEIGLLTALRVMDLTSNELKGTLPTEIGNCVALENLYLISNEFSGTIPSDSFGKLMNLEILDLSANKLSGSVPVTTTGVCGLRTYGKLDVFRADCDSSVSFYLECPNPECCTLCE